VVATVTAQLGALLGLVFGAGAWLVVDGLSRRPRPAAGQSRLWRHRILAGATPMGIAGAVAAAAVVGVWTRWPVAALLAAIAVWALPGVLTGARTSTRTQARLEAVAVWTESLRGTLQAAAGLEQAIAATAATAPEPIRAEVVGLAGAIGRGVRLPEALHAFADDLDHPDADRVVAALLLASSGHARNLADQLAALAAAAREQAAARLRVQTEWSTTRTSVRVIIAITLVMAAGMVAFNRDFLHPYDTAAGQVVLAVVGAMFGAGFWWLARLSRITDPPRVLAEPDNEGQPERVVVR
jgi:Flp pilus assembly protein TadB